MSVPIERIAQTFLCVAGAGRWARCDAATGASLTLRPIFRRRPAATAHAGQCIVQEKFFTLESLKYNPSLHDWEGHVPVKTEKYVSFHSLLSHDREDRMSVTDECRQSIVIYSGQRLVSETSALERIRGGFWFWGNSTPGNLYDSS